ncbi:hypothetical protein E1162_05935 [Rhodobacteraceae bacterium RKSG542]|uniref:hypothetical protein n=1 Tax=Pseudovibrio flavus TaxID=2529854 RepID=UPI0012BC9B65|nr:hypothetical protein [Pseudovibrio flavus]MTI16773.1 hypothetical protein [Pseudovibrio flavus]
MARSIAECLADFESSSGSAETQAAEMQDVVSLLPKGYGEGGDWVTRVFEAYENGFSEGQEASKSECDARIEEMRKEMEAALVKGEQEWKMQQGQELRTAVTASLQNIEVRVAESVAAILVPFLDEQSRHMAVGALSEVLKRHLSASKEPILEVSGPRSLFDLFQEKLGANAPAMDYVESSGVDLNVSVGNMNLSTGLEQWLQQLHSTVGDGQ